MNGAAVMVTPDISTGTIFCISFSQENNKRIEKARKAYLKSAFITIVVTVYNQPQGMLLPVPPVLVPGLWQIKETKSIVKTTTSGGT